ncbi:MAG TPA: universal stress protein [Leptolyngbyaceae cyanobacterium M65_K2018_010]|nr:universal stress protein [Leptolyngbyaceae cyanobacterium M65_K2018_010]
MFKNILVALDNSPLRRGVFDQALGLAQATGARLMLLHVLSAYEEGSPGIPIRSYQAYYPVLDDAVWKDYQRRWEEFESARLALLQEEAEIAQAAGVTVEFTQAAGDPATTICNLAQSWGADLILVGSHQRRGLGELLLGSVSNHVMHHAPCSVMVVHGEALAGSEVSPVAATARVG